MNPMKLQIIIDAQNKADAVMKEVSGQFSTLNGQIDKLQPAFGAMAAAGTAAFAAVAGVVGVSINNFIEAERSTRQLEHAVIDVSKGTRDQVDAILAVTDALQKKSGVDGDALTMGVAQLSTFGLQTQSVLDLTKSLADLTVNQSGVNAGADQYVQSANTIAKALQGQFGILEKSGIRFTEAQQKLIQYGTESEKVAALTEGLNQNLRETTDTIANTAEGSMAKLKQSLGDISEAIGSAFLPILQQVVEKIIPVVQQISTWASENPKLVAAILAAIAALSLIVAALGTLGLIIPPIIAAVEALGVAAAAVGTVFTILTGPVGLVIAAIAALIAIGVLLYTHWDEVKTFAIGVWEAIKNAVTQAWTAIVAAVTGAMQAAWAAVVAGWQSITAAFTSALQAVMGVMNTVGKAISDAFWFMVDFIIGAWKMLLDFLFPGWEQTLTAVFNKGVEIFTAIYEFIVTILQQIVDWIGARLEDIATIWNEIWGGVSTTTTSVFDTIKNAVSAAMTWIYTTVITPVLNAIKTVWNTVWGGISSAFTTLWDGIKAAAGGAMDWIKQKVDSLKAPIESLLALAQRAIDLAKSVGSGIGKAVSSVVSTGSSITGRAVGGPVGTNVPHLVGENGPEIFWPNGAGRIVPNGALGGAGISITVTGNTFMGREGIAEQIGNDILKVLKQNMKL